MVSLSRSSPSNGGLESFIPSPKPFARIAPPALLVEVQPFLQVAKTVGASRRLSATVSYSLKYEVPSLQKKQHPKFGSHHLKLTPCCSNIHFFVAYYQIVLAHISERQCLSFACHLRLVED